MSTLREFLPNVPDGDFRLRHWLSASFPRCFSLQRRHLAVPAAYPHGTNVYTSLRELILSSPPRRFTSPPTAGFEIRIRNPLVKQAAYAYLQMTPSSVQSQRPHRRFFVAFSDAFRPLRRCLGYIGRLLCCSQVYNAW